MAGLGSMNEKFQELNTIHTAIKDIDRLYANNNSENILEDVLFAVKEIDKSTYGKDHVDIIVKSIRSALVEIYTSKLNEVNSDISIESKDNID